MDAGVDNSNEMVCIGQPFYPPGSVFNSDPAIHSCHDHLHPVILVPYFSIGAFLNVLTFILFFISHRKERQITSARVPYALVMTLCFTDVTFLMAGQMIWAISYFRQQVFSWTFSYFVSIFFLSTCLRFSRYIVVGMSIERFISIKKAFIYDNIITFARVAGATIFVLSYSAGISAVELVSLRINQRSCDDEPTHWNKWQYLCGSTSSAGEVAASLIHALNLWSLIENFLLGIVLLTCNIIVYRCLSEMRARISIVCPRNRDEYCRMIEMINGIPAEFSRLMAAIAVVYAFTVFPYGVSIVTDCQMWRRKTFQFEVEVWGGGLREGWEGRGSSCNKSNFLIPYILTDFFTPLLTL